jgi:hypothetical protein
MVDEVADDEVADDEVVDEVDLVPNDINLG